MKHASRLLVLALCVTSSISANTADRTFEQVLQEAKDAAPAFIDWGVTQMHKYPAVPGIVTAALLSKAKESITLKRSSFIIWSVLGAVVFAEPYRLFAQEYLAQRDGYKQDIEKAKESAKVAGQAVASAVQKGSQEALEKVAEKIDELKNGSDSK